MCGLAPASGESCGTAAAGNIQPYHTCMCCTCIADAFEKSAALDGAMNALLEEISAFQNT
jgi:hypothetical protein